MNKSQHLLGMISDLKFTPGKERKYKVGIPKIYFPVELRTTDPGNHWYEVVEVRANSRTLAALKVWEKNGMRWLPKMNPKVTSIRKVSLDVDDPEAGTGGVLGRLFPITVYQD